MRQRDDFLDALESRRRPQRREPGAIAEIVQERPGTAAAFVTFSALFAFVAYNAVWAQPHSHGNAFYSMRDHVAEQAPVAMASKKTKPAQQQVAQGPKPQPDPTVLGVQATLKNVGLYQGELDGRLGTKTRQSIAAYQKILGLPENGEIDDVLLSNLRLTPKSQTADAETIAAAENIETAPNVTNEVVASIRPTPRPKREEDQSNLVEAPQPKPKPVEDVASDGDTPSTLMMIQAGLRAFGNPELVADGKMGPMTKTAIEEFQMVTRLPINGIADERVLEELRRQGYVN
jgi:peptidoglycan hydrolase-like protein with peptidoglycan-binding domain